MGRVDPTYAKAQAKPIDLWDAVDRYRANETRLRRLAKSNPTRNVGRTVSAIEAGLRDRTTIEGSLSITGHDQLLGELVEESKLNARLAEDKDRPELRRRLRLTRARITLLADQD